MRQTIQSAEQRQKEAIANFTNELAFMQNMVKSKNKAIITMTVIVALLVLGCLGLLIFDLVNPDIGYIRLQ